MKKKTRLVMIVLAMAMFVVATVLFVGCKKGGEGSGTEQPKIEYQAGTYYFDAEGDEYTFSIAKDGSFMLTMNGQPMSGVAQSEDGKSITLAMSNGDKISAKLSGDVLTVSIKGTEYRFLLKTPYTVSFEANGGSAVAPVSVINGKTLAKPANPIYDGHRFLGWYEDEAFTKPFMFGGKPVTSDVTLYARWAEVAPGTQEFTVSFDLNYDTDEAYPDTETVGGKLYDVPAPAERSGYIFKGWYVSMYQDGSMLSYKYDEDTVFDANTTLFAKWESSAVTSRLRSPDAEVNPSGVSWNGNPEARSYKVRIIGPEGVVVDQTSATTFVSFDFAGAPSGDYTVSVTACAAVSANDSEPTVIYYKNKALARVSVFSVVEPSTLIFNAVEGAEKYLITVECGNSEHVHDKLDNGASTDFNFSNCEMKEGGIKFTVTAVAEGYASSVSDEFVYNRELAPVSGMYLNEQTQVLAWNAVPNASEYFVSVVDANGEQTFAVGKATSFSLKEFEAVEGGIIVRVYPATKGYNSPEATTYIYNKVMLA
ncbi:MAG: InlB B-repeat-containing protein, partial [Clostridia bacterium]|nr:InlB B-repeat-containing protein [Clostridia bacterium]